MQTWTDVGDYVLCTVLQIMSDFVLMMHRKFLLLMHSKGNGQVLGQRPVRSAQGAEAAQYVLTRSL